MSVLCSSTAFSDTVWNMPSKNRRCRERVLTWHKDILNVVFAFSHVKRVIPSNPWSNFSTPRFFVVFGLVCGEWWAESRGRIHGVWDPIYAGVDCNLRTSPYVHSRVDSNTFIIGNPMPESALTLYARVDFIPRQVLWIWPPVQQ